MCSIEIDEWLQTSVYFDRGLASPLRISIGSGFREPLLIRNSLPANRFRIARTNYFSPSFLFFFFLDLFKTKWRLNEDKKKECCMEAWTAMNPQMHLSHSGEVSWSEPQWTRNAMEAEGGLAKVARTGSPNRNQPAIWRKWLVKSSPLPLEPQWNQLEWISPKRLESVPRNRA